jgi:hypothetical protein
MLNNFEDSVNYDGEQDDETFDSYNKNESNSEITQKYSNNSKNDDEIDPLDAFMNEINKQVKILDKSDKEKEKKIKNEETEFPINYEFDSSTEDVNQNELLDENKTKFATVEELIA